MWHGPLEQSRLAAEDEQDRQAGEGGRRPAVPDHPGHQVEVAVGPVDVLFTVRRAEDQEEDDGEEEREERQLAAAPEQSLLGPELVRQELHSAGSSVSDR